MTTAGLERATRRINRLIPFVIRFLFVQNAMMFFPKIHPGFQQVHNRKRVLECAHSLTTCRNYLALK